MFELASRGIERDMTNYLRPSFDPPSSLLAKSPSPAPSEITLYSIHSPHPMNQPQISDTNRRPWWKRTWDGIYENRGMFFLLISQFFGSLMAMMARLLSTGTMGTQKFHALQILFVRQSITSAGCLIWLWKIGVSPWGDRKIRLLLVARGVGGFFGIFGLYYSLAYLDLSDATVITFLAPIVASYACSVIPALREPFTRFEAFAALVSLSGVILIARPQTLFSSSPSPSTPLPLPPSNSTLPPITPPNHHHLLLLPRTPQSTTPITPHQRLVAILVSLLGVLGAASAFTTIRWIGKRAHPLVTVFYFAGWCTFVSLTSLLVLPSIGGIIFPRSLLEWGLLGGIGVCGFVMQFLLTLGLQREKAGRGMNMVYTQMLFALAWERVIWGTVPGGWSIAGSVAILGSAVAVGLRKEKEKKGGKEALGDEERDGEVAEEEIRGLMEDHGRESWESEDAEIWRDGRSA